MITGAAASYFERRKLVCQPSHHPKMEAGGMIVTAKVPNQILPPCANGFPHIRIISPIDMQNRAGDGVEEIF